MQATENTERGIFEMLRIQPADTSCRMIREFLSVTSVLSVAVLFFKS